jgi:hypothetical protein
LERHHPKYGGILRQEFWICVDYAKLYLPFRVKIPYFLSVGEIRFSGDSCLLGLSDFYFVTVFGSGIITTGGIIRSGLA